MFALIVVWLPLTAMSIFEALQELGGPPHTPLQELGFATLRAIWPKYTPGQRRFVSALSLVFGVVGLAGAWVGEALYYFSIGMSPFDDFAKMSPWFDYLLGQYAWLVVVYAWFEFPQKCDS